MPTLSMTMRPMHAAILAIALAAASIPIAEAQARPPAQTRILGYGTFKAIGCLLAIGGFIAGNVALALKVKRLGGIISGCTP